MIILGFDPGVATVGFGVLRNENREFRLLDTGCITTPKTETLARRLTMIRSDAKKLIELHKPDLIGIEELFFVKNIKTGIAVAHARGVLLQLCEEYHVPTLSFTPLQIKQAVTSYGQATKDQVQGMLTSLLRLPGRIHSDDAADAVAVAFCAANSYTHHELSLK